MAVCLGFKDAVQGNTGPRGGINRDIHPCLLELLLLKYLSDLEQGGHPYHTLHISSCLTVISVLTFCFIIPGKSCT